MAVVDQQTTALVYLEAREAVLVAETQAAHPQEQAHQGKVLLGAMAAIHPIGQAVVAVLVLLVLLAAQLQLMCRAEVLAAQGLQVA